MEWYKEWCPTVYMRGRFLPLERINRITQTVEDPGYASVYEFHPNSVEAMKETKQKFNTFPVRSDGIVIDVDEMERLPVVEEAIKARKVPYTVWLSGGKGYHFYIPHKPHYSLNLPLRQRKWVETLGVDVDFSIYQHGRIISLPGRVHPKTGRKKIMLRQVWGNTAVDLPNIDQQESSQQVIYPGLGESTQEQLLYLVWKLEKALRLPPEEGNRHTTLWHLSKSCAEAGLSFNVAVGLILAVNDSFTNPKHSEEALKAIQQGYK
jgi:hypothetical protein